LQRHSLIPCVFFVAAAGCASQVLAQPRPAVAVWSFDGSLADHSGSRAVQVASNPDLQLAPGFRIDCSVRLEKLPAEGRHIAIKDGAYQLRLNSQKEGGCFAFFVNLDGWEPRVCCDERVVPGQWYRLTARWDGSALTLDVNGKRSRVMRSGLAKATGKPLTGTCRFDYIWVSSAAIRP
jgi:hypothetical protein